MFLEDVATAQLSGATEGFATKKSRDILALVKDVEVANRPWSAKRWIRNSSGRVPDQQGEGDDKEMSGNLFILHGQHREGGFDIQEHFST